MVRLPAVADRFYPGEEAALDTMLTGFFDHVPPSPKIQALAAVAPHAGYVFSGSICAETLKNIVIPETVVILGPNHQGYGPPIALSQENWQMPWGEVPVNQDFTDLLAGADAAIQISDSAHRYEHSLEVQIPFLQKLQPRLTIVPLVLSRLSYPACQGLAQVLADSIKEFKDPVLLLASSDMSHYESRQQAQMKDTMALDQLTALNPEKLYTTVLDNGITMCGIIPVTVALQSALLLGATTAQIIRYSDSGAVSGDTEQVVGYAGALMYRA
ncbi:MAG: AmmeMemoRadiSam system protein B [Desulfopila sp.]